ncbi:MAG TPA: substrate-binding domain-containing protein [Streptosporangiaceae bacterium]|nr:substrate-binding domain-containing protein [Streptosporangiaceae bacterium]
MGKVDPKVDEAIETLNMKDGPTRRRLLTGTGLVSATAAASALLTACSSSSSSAAKGGNSTPTIGDFPKTPPWQFWFVNHVTTNLFFVPTRSGYTDAAKLLGLPIPKWGGSVSALVPQMVSYLESAIAGKANGIATTVVTADSFTTPVANAMNAGIPVISYNADGIYKSDGTPVIGTNRLCYVGQALYLSGQQLGQRILSLVDSGDIVIFIATPGAGNIQPRFDGAVAAIKASGKPIKVHLQATGALTAAELSAEKAFMTGHKTLKGAFAVDAGSTELLAQALKATGLTIPAGGFDLTPGTLSAIQSGAIDFTIDQEPYLQGFLPTLYLYLYNLSGGLVLPPDTDTGLTFVTKSNVGPYLNSKTSYEGSTGVTLPTLVPRSGPIQNPVATTST